MSPQQSVHGVTLRLIKDSIYSTMEQAMVTSPHLMKQKLHTLSF